MKSIVSIMMVCSAMLSPLCSGSELVISLEQKVLDSDLVVLGSVTAIELGDFRKSPELSQKTQNTKISFRIDECLIGNETGEILIDAHSVSYIEGAPSHLVGATAGFSIMQVGKGERFIAYLKKVHGRYRLTAESNQFFEWIDYQSKKVRDIGQTRKMVSLEWKKEKLRLIALKKKK